MSDTGFTVPQGKLGRLTTAHAAHPETGEICVLDDPANSWWRTRLSFPDTSGWLVSTIDDYWSFVSMVLAGGTWHGRRVLSPESVVRLTTDRLSAAQREASILFLGEQEGWGLGLAVPATGSTAPLPSGVGWDGGTGTTWRSNPHSGVTGILFTQRAANSPVPTPLVNDFWSALNAAAEH
jgi:CubicO group peptidase (beta-lactamase class C family)